MGSLRFDAWLSNEESGQCFSDDLPDDDHAACLCPETFCPDCRAEYDADMERNAAMTIQLLAADRCEICDGPLERWNDTEICQDCWPDAMRELAEWCEETSDPAEPPA